MNIQISFSLCRDNPDNDKLKCSHYPVQFSGTKSLILHFVTENMSCEELPNKKYAFQ